MLFITQLLGEYIGSPLRVLFFLGEHIGQPLHNTSAAEEDDTFSAPAGPTSHKTFPQCIKNAGFQQIISNVKS